MKMITTLVSILLFNLAFGLHPTPIKTIETKSVINYSKQEHPSVSLPTNFGKPFIINQEDIDLLENVEIYHIDLIYTQFKSSPDFDQNRLNKNRMNELQKVLPQINKDNPSWNLVEQTGARDQEIAKTYFHGFEIYYKPKAKTTIELIEFMSDFEKPTKRYTIMAEEGAQFTYSSGSTVHIPKNAVKDKEGNIIEGEYQIEYTEFRNPAEIALSGLPMKYNNGEENLNFTSKGMYEIKGTQNGEELFLTQPITVDFNCTQSLEDTQFYSLDKENGEWTELKKIVAKKENVQQDSKTIESEVVVLTKGDWVGEVRSSNWDYQTKNEGNVSVKYKKENAIMEMDDNAWKVYEHKKNTKEFDNFNIEIGKKEQTIKIKQNQAWNLTLVMSDNKPFGSEWVQPIIVTDKGHTYPNLVKGLKSEKFGVYNCDQIYRTKNPSTIHPKYVNQKTGAEINQPDVACLMDLNYNGSFSFDPKYITLNTKGKNALLLFTKDKKVFIAMPDRMNNATANSNKKPIIRMKDITDQMKSSKDLAAILEI